MRRAASVHAAGHFGELLQGRLGADGPVVLISLPCPVLSVTARLVPARAFALHCPQGNVLTPDRARKFLRRLGLALPCRVTLHASMPLGGGAGSSTAALVALARLAGWTGPAYALARACLAVEGATDPLMFDHPERLLWASRRAEGVADLPSLPPFDIIGGFYGPPVHTTPADTRFSDISDLVINWRAAAAAQDLSWLAQLATTSANRSFALRGIADPTAGLAHDLGALGYVAAHTGSARGLIYPRSAVPDDARAALRKAGFTRLVQFTAGGLS